MSERKFFIITLSVSASAVLLLSLFTFAVISFKESSTELFSLTDGREYNGQLIRKFPFDSIILGTSLSQGFKCSEFDKAFGGQSMKICSSGAPFAEFDLFLKFAVKHKKIKRVMMDAPVHFFAKAQTFCNFPFELYQDDIAFQNWKKSFSINSLVEEFDFFRDYLRGKIKYTTRDDLYDWNKKYPCGTKYFAQSVLYKPYKNFLGDDKCFDQAPETAENVLLPIFRANPEIEFIIFFPPFSIMNFQNIDCEKYCKLKKQIVDSILECKNVRLYDFETAFHITKDFNNYKDRAHYSGKINSWMISEISKNNYRVTAETKDLFLETLRKEWKTFDFKKEYDRLAAAYSKK